MRKLDQFTTAYLACALWSSNDESTPAGGEPMDSNYSIYDFAPIAIDQAVTDCDEFRKVAGTMLDGWADEQAGHDFWLTRNGHGAGFWDRGSPFGDELTALVGFRTRFDNVDPYIGDDGSIYF